MFKKVLKINLKVLGTIAVGLLLVQIISAYFFGIMAEKQFDVQFKRLTDSALVKVEKHEYHRGWFTANETVVLAVNNQILKNVMAILPGVDKESATTLVNGEYKITYTTQITHGLFAGWLHGNLLPTIAYATTTVQFPARLNNLLTSFFAKETPLTITNIVYLNKSGKYTIYSPTFNYDEALSGVKVTWGGLKLKVGYNSSFNQFSSALSVPSFDMDAPTKGKFNLSDFHYNSDTSYSVNNIKVGSTELGLAKLSVALEESKNIQFKFGEAVRLLTGVNTADFLNGIDAIDPTNFVISGISYSSLSSDQNKLFNATAKAHFSELTSNKQNYGPMDLDFALEHIAAAEFSRLADHLNEAASQDQTAKDSRDKTIAILKADMTPIFVATPKVILNNFSLITPSGKISLSGFATTHDFVASDMNNQDKFMQKLLVNVNFSIPKPILAYLFLLQMKYFLTAGNAQMDQQSSDALAKVVNILLDNQLQVWLKKGYLTESNNLLSSTISLESGVVSLNKIPTK